MTVPLPDIAAVLPFLPRRYPAVLIDRVDACEPGRSFRGLKNVTISEPFFQGHFPGYPVMPGVLVIECLVQAIALLAVASGRLPLDGSTELVVPGIPSCRFKRQVLPGDQLALEVDLPVEGSFDRVEVRARVDGEIATEAVLEVRIGPAGTV